MYQSIRPSVCLYIYLAIYLSIHVYNILPPESLPFWGNLFYFPLLDRRTATLDGCESNHR